MRIRVGVVVGAIALLALAAASVAAANGGKRKLEVCKHGCHYRTVQSAVNAVKNGSKTVIEVAPGTYKEGVRVVGHRYDGLQIVGTGKSPSDVVLQGKNARVHIPNGGTALAQNGIEGLNVDGLKMTGLWAKNYAANGFFVHADPNNHCKGFLMKDDLASFNRSYGLFAQNCIGGRVTHSSGWGQGDSAIYIGQTPFQKKPKWTSIDHDQAYENVLGYSGTNSKYVDIHDSDWWNNGVGIVPNTLSSEKFQPTGTGKIHDNNIFWNNFNYFLPKSPVKTVSNGLGMIGDATVNYPTGVGVAIFGGDGWKVTDNQIFGNFKWGAAAFSDPFNKKAVSAHNHFVDNKMGRGGSDPNGHDFFTDGSGKGTCFSGNHSSSFDVASDSQTPASLLYPTCPAPSTSGTGSNLGDGAMSITGQVGALAAYVLSTPPCSQQNSWSRHSHPKFKKFKPIDTKNMGACS
jgi:hypothetical protein